MKSEIELLRAVAAAAADARNCQWSKSQDAQQTRKRLDDALVALASYVPPTPLSPEAQAERRPPRLGEGRSDERVENCVMEKCECCSGCGRVNYPRVDHSLVCHICRGTGKVPKVEAVWRMRVKS